MPEASVAKKSLSHENQQGGNGDKYLQCLVRYSASQIWWLVDNPHQMWSMGENVWIEVGLGCLSVTGVMLVHWIVPSSHAMSWCRYYTWESASCLAIVSSASSCVMPWAPWLVGGWTSLKSYTLRTFAAARHSDHCIKICSKWRRFKLCSCVNSTFLLLQYWQGLSTQTASITPEIN
jgi:hypothetical protein